MSRPKVFSTSGCSPGHFASSEASSAAVDHASLRPPARAFSTISSTRVGWMRPSSTSRVSAMRAISRRTGSKQASATASGVSSMIRSTPVAASSARMLRPSRPMMRPFMSSLGMGTTETVRLAHDVRHEALHGGRQDLARPQLRLLLRLRLDEAETPGRVLADLLVELLGAGAHAPPRRSGRRRVLFPVAGAAAARRSPNVAVLACCR